MINLIFAGIFIFLALWFRNKLRQLPPAEKKKLLYRSVFGVLVLVLVIGILSHRIHPLGGLIAILVPMINILSRTLMQTIPFLLRQSGGVANFKTEHIHAQVNVYKKTLTGSIIKGPHQGKSISELTDENIEELKTFYKTNDKKAYYLLHLSKKTGFEEDNSPPPPPSFSSPSREEAMQLLGLKGNPTKEEIITAYKKLMNRVHPDKGGNDFLASRVNLAKETLLAHLNN